MTDGIQLAVLVGAAVFTIKALQSLVEDDYKTTVRVGLEKLTSWSAKALLPKTKADEFIQWFEGEVDWMRQEGGSGILVCAYFLMILLPYYVWQNIWSGSPKK